MVHMKSSGTRMPQQGYEGAIGDRHSWRVGRRAAGLVAVLGVGLFCPCGSWAQARQGAVARAEGAGQAAAATPAIAWAVPALPYRVLVEVPPCDIGRRVSPTFPAAVELDFTSPAFAALKLEGPVDLDSIQVLRHDPVTGKVLPGR